MPVLRACSALAAGCLAVACTSTAASVNAAATAPASQRPSAGQPATAAATPTPKPKPKPKPKPRVTESTVRTPDGSVITVAVFRGPVRFVLHNGSGDPGWSASSKGVKAGPAVGAGERRHLLAAFNGGFKLATGSGGYEQEGKVVVPLTRGDASFIIDRSGKARIAVWGHGTPLPGEHVYSVRQNLAPLVYHGRPAATAAAWWNWGATLGGGSYVARSAVGMDSAGDIIYAGSMSAVPQDLALALVRHGARIGMELDINPAWVQLDVARHPGGALRAAVPGQIRPADQFIWGWSRDFFTVLG